MKKIIVILLGIIVYCACDDDNNHVLVKPDVSGFTGYEHVQVYYDWRTNMDGRKS